MLCQLIRVLKIQLPFICQKNKYKLPPFNPLATGDLKFYQCQGLSIFWRLFNFFFYKTSVLFAMVAYSPYYSPYFKSSWPPDHNVIIFLYHQVHDALNNVTMTPPWHRNSGTYMSYWSLTKEGHICPSSPVRVNTCTTSSLLEKNKKTNMCPPSLPPEVHITRWETTKILGMYLKIGHDQNFLQWTTHT